MLSRKKRRKRKARTGPPPNWLRGTLIALLLVVLFGAGLVAGIVAAYSRNLPDISRLADYQPESSTRIFARDGTLLASVYKENRIYVPLSHIPLIMQEAVIANEDHNFYYHHGVDFGGIVRAAFADLTHQEFQGASTITQQLARKLFLNDEVSISRKIQEALLAMEIERYYTKDEILERYLNIVYLGSGAYGVDAAAHTYFGESIEKVDLPQAAMIAGVIAAPSDYSPFVNFSLAKDRQQHVLQRMVESGYITQAQADQAANAPVALTKERAPGLQGYLYPYYTTYVIARLERLFGKQAVEEGGLQVYTALDPRMQRVAQASIDWGLARAKAMGVHAGEAALVSIRPSTGEIVAMVGGKGFSLDNQFNRAWQARRQPGSSFKLYVYTAAIDSGLPANTVIDDSPVSYPMGDGTMWSPRDDDDSYMGPVTLRVGLELSRNIVAVKLADRVGLDKIIQYAQRMGVTSPLAPNLSLALGSSGVTVLDQATGYATIADQGIHIDPSAIRLVKDSLGNVVLDDQYPQATEVVSAGTAFIITSMLEDVINHGTGYPNAIIGRPAAGKTGTTSDFRDAWFVGFTPDLVTAVWMGNDDYSRMNEAYGGGIPASIWARYMKTVLAGVPKHDFTMPADQVVRVASCSGGSEYYLIGTQPSSGGCGTVETAQDPTATPLPTIAPGTVAPGGTQPPNSVGDGTHYVPLGSPSPAPSARP
ncbi:MAG TPA: PBP1A family penicillin-binding protein [Candidatus Baltobacteraceae bacterium]|nr:PBP1A family penicillin-binding protein [Candidatus Baltobacteraceae bacterium]